MEIWHCCAILRCQLKPQCGHVEGGQCKFETLDLSKFDPSEREAENQGLSEVEAELFRVSNSLQLHEGDLQVNC